MDDLKFGSRNKRGDFTPNEPLKTGPLFSWPWSLPAILSWLPGYFLPWNLLFMILAVLSWWLTVPSLDQAQELSFAWIALIWVRNMACVLAIHGVLELRLYVQRGQGTRFK